MTTTSEIVHVSNPIRRVSVEPKRSALSLSILNNDQNNNNNKKCRITTDHEDETDNKNTVNGIEFFVTAKDMLKESGNDDEMMSEEELNKIWYQDLKSSDRNTVRAALQKLYLYSYLNKNDNVYSNNLCESICKNHMIPFITGTMYRFMDSTDILKPGFGLLINIMTTHINNFTVDSVIATLDVVVLALQKHNSNSILQGDACWLLERIFNSCWEQVQNVIKPMGVLKYIVNAMETHPECNEIQYFSCGALIHYYKHSTRDDQKDVREILLSSPAGILSKAMNHETWEVCKEAAKLMQLLCNDIISSESD